MPLNTCMTSIYPLAEPERRVTIRYLQRTIYVYLPVTEGHFHDFAYVS